MSGTVAHSAGSGRSAAPPAPPRSPPSGPGAPHTGCKALDNLRACSAAIERAIESQRPRTQHLEQQLTEVEGQLRDAHREAAAAERYTTLCSSVVLTAPAPERLARLQRLVQAQHDSRLSDRGSGAGAERSAFAAGLAPAEAEGAELPEALGAAEHSTAAPAEGLRERLRAAELVAQAAAAEVSRLRAQLAAEVQGRAAGGSARVE
eukprot:TRINITY_DN24388_c0_g1_i5.p2 TRINITY_DN24388_c0_g1~~TRINITY_DN24388_c0_g1_i5.p2  ORF type:complete len:206 (+),score=59.92 TRINITY_DN24388_c0_g1_i5:72-689(+)